MRTIFTAKLSVLLLALSCFCLTASGTARIAALSQTTESETSSPVETKEDCHQITARRLSLKAQPHVSGIARALDEQRPPLPAHATRLPRPRQCAPPPLRAPPLA